MSDEKQGVVISPLGPKTYAIVKFMAQLLLPAIAALYFGLAQTWHIPNAEEVVGTVTVFDTFLGVLLAASTGIYNRSSDKYGGSVEIQPDANEENSSVKVSLKPDQLHKNEITVKVNHRRPRPN